MIQKSKSFYKNPYPHFIEMELHTVRHTPFESKNGKNIHVYCVQYIKATK